MQKDNKKIKLTISLLVSNSINTIHKCMNSISPLLENIESELIIVDTGGIDGSIDIARKYATKIIPFTWCNDFAKARNAGLEEARGEWFLFLDDDEWFESVEEIIEFFQTGEYLKYESASYEIRNYKNKEGTQWNSTRYYRMIKLTKETRFVSPIHEILEPVYAPEKEFKCYVHHYGYVFETKEDKIKHSERNIKILNEVLEKYPHDIRLQMQLAQEYDVAGDLNRSYKISEESIAAIVSIKYKNPEQVLVAGWHMKNLLHIEIEKGSKEDAYEIAKEFLKYEWTNIVTKNNILHVLSNMAFFLKKYQECYKYTMEYIQNYKQILKKSNNKIGQYLSDQYKSYSKENRFRTVLNGWRSASCCRKKLEQINLLEILAKEEFCLINIIELNDLILSIVNIEDRKKKQEILELFIKQDVFRKLLIGLLEDESYILSKDKVIELASEKAYLYPEFIPYKIILEYRRGNNIEYLFDEYFDYRGNILFLNQEILEIIQDTLDISKYVAQINMEDWINYIGIFLQRAKAENIQTIIEICNNYKNYELKIYFLKIQCYEKIFQDKILKKEKFSIVDKFLKDYINTVIELNLNIYKEELVKKRKYSYLPDNCIFCNEIKDMYENGLDEITRVKIVKDAALLYPKMAEFCKIYLIKMQEERESATNEFLQLASKIKKTIRTYIELGQINNAHITLQQLEQLVPNDPELLELKKMLM